jgi:protein-tyrosine phosphatase
LSGYVDIHAHLLPGIDDGPGDLDGALAMARAAVGAGTRMVAATPHLRADFPDVHVDELAERVGRLREALEHESIELALVGAAETSLVWALEASPEELSLATYGQHGGDLLIETPMTATTTLPELLYRVRARGFRITLAHPERSSEFSRDPGKLAELVDQGVLLQVNADALVSSRGGSTERGLAERLCREGLAHVLASDGHRAASWRPVTSLAAGVEAASLIVGRQRAEWMAREAPAAIISGTELPEPPAVVPPGRRRRRLFGGRAE